METKAESEKLKILVLDDEKLVRFTIAAYLRGAGFTVTEAAAPAEALALIKRDQFHAIVSDVMMGDMVDGFMFRSLVREIDDEVPIVYLTSMMNDAGNAFMEKVMEDVRSYYVAKSAPRQVLVARLRQVVKSHLAELNVRKLEKSMQKSLELASLVQRAMLPKWALANSNYIYASCWQPMSEVSGDLFEHFPLSDDAALFIFGDISGHGTGAALAMTALQAYLKRFSNLTDERARAVHRIAAQIHDFIITNLGGISYMATTVAYVNAKEKLVRYINCGCPEPIFCRRDGSILDMNPKRLGCMPTGLAEGAKYEEDNVVNANFGDTIVLFYSDGVTDLSSDAEGEDPLPDGMLPEIVRMAVKSVTDEKMLLGGVPYKIYRALQDIGYTNVQDDISLFALTTNNRPVSAVYKTEVSMTPSGIDRVCHEAGKLIAERFGDEELGVKTDLLLSEHLMNIYEHGLDDFGRQHEISIVCIEETSTGFEVWVWDRGAPWQDVANASMSEAEEALDERNQELAEGGRGRAIVTKVAESVSVERFMNLNRTVFHMRAAKKKKGSAI